MIYVHQLAYKNFVIWSLEFGICLEIWNWKLEIKNGLYLPPCYYNITMI